MAVSNADAENSVRPAQVLAALSKFRAALQVKQESNGTATNQNTDGLEENSVFRVCRAYEDILVRRGAVDFDLLLIRSIRLLEDHPQVSNFDDWTKGSVGEQFSWRTDVNFETNSRAPILGTVF